MVSYSCGMKSDMLHTGADPGFSERMFGQTSAYNIASVAWRSSY